MNNLLNEQQIIPYHKSPPYGERALVIAPHPDDETLGCGGTIRLLTEAKKEVKVIFLTSGEKADPSNKLSHKNSRAHTFFKGGMGGFSEASHVTAYSLLREKEAEKALGILGVDDYEFLRFPDRELAANYGDVLKRLLEITGDYLPDAIYSPSMVELNPDHRTAAALSMEVQKAYNNISGRSPLKVIFYEVTVPLRPNMLVDVTPVYKKKSRAVRKYRSQNRLIDYLRHITALNTLRSLTLSGSSFAEAFWICGGALSDEDIRGWLSYNEAKKAE